MRAAVALDMLDGGALREEIATAVRGVPTEGLGVNHRCPGERVLGVDQGGDGVIGGDATIRDPGQKREGGLWFIYLASSVVMLINGLISHRMTVQHYNESQEATESK